MQAVPMKVPSYRPLSPGVQDTEAAGLQRIARDDLDWGPSPLPHADAPRAAKLDRSAGTLDGHAGPCLGDARPVGATVSQKLGEDSHRVVTLERHERGRIREHITDGCRDSCTERAEPLGQVAQDGIATSAWANNFGHCANSGCPAGAPIMSSARRVSRRTELTIDAAGSG